MCVLLAFITSMKIKRAVNILAVLILSAWTPSITLAADKALTHFKYAVSVGWIHGACLAIRNSTLEPGRRLTLIVFSDKPVLRQTTIKAVTPQECPALLPDRAAVNRRSDLSYYALDDHGQDVNDMALGVVTDRKLSDLAVMSSTMVRLDLDGDGKPEIISTCASREGIHFFVWPGKAYQGKPLWRDYYYVGYDLTPTCP